MATVDGRGHDTLMWEVVAAPGRLHDLVAWVTAAVVERLHDEPSCHDVAVYEAGDEEGGGRAVVIAHFAGEPVAVPEPPPDLVRRPPGRRVLQRLQ